MLLLFLLNNNTLYALEENWYAFISFGFANHKYSEPLESQIKGRSSIIRRSQFAMDRIAFYSNLHNYNTIAGPIITQTIDSFSESGTSYFDMYHFLYGGSIVKSSGSEPGNSFFVKLDTGVAHSFRDGALKQTVLKRLGKWGFGINASFGYGLPITDGSKLLFCLGLAYKSIEFNEYFALIYHLGVLW